MFVQALRRFFRQRPPAARSLESGQGIVEYALVIVLVGIVVIGSLVWVGRSASITFERILCAVDYRRCPARPIYDSDTRCTSGEVVRIESLTCSTSTSTLTMTVYSTCPNTVIASNLVAANLNYNQYSNRHTISQVNNPNCATLPSTLSPSFSSSRANGTVGNGSIANVPVTIVP
jgi:Flp pilus assembly pilin Flp